MERRHGCDTWDNSSSSASISTQRRVTAGTTDFKVQAKSETIQVSPSFCTSTCPVHLFMLGKLQALASTSLSIDICRLVSICGVAIADVHID